MLLILFVVLGVVFYHYPQIDIYTTALFYDSQSHTFPLEHNQFIIFLHKSVKYICGLYVIGALFFAGKTLLRTMSIHPKHYKKVIYVTLVCLLGPGLIVHQGFKDNFNRARPNHTIEFGGTLNMTSAFQISDQCEKNCSFASGHASVGFMFIALAFLLKGGARNQMAIFSVFLGFLIGASRIVEGDHYLSDVIFAGAIVYLTAFYLAKIMRIN
jgi:lipid A 4'-phosphatase